MTGATSTIRIDIDASGAQRGAAQANAALASIGSGSASNVNAINQNLQNLGTSGTAAAGGVNKVGGAFTAANNNGKSLNAAIAQIGQHVQTMVTALAGATSAMNAQTAAASHLSTQLNNLAASQTHAGSSAHTASASHAGLAGELKGLALEAVGAYVGLEGIKKAMEMSDEMSGMNAKLRLAVQGWADYNLAQQQVQSIAQQTRSDLVSTGELYGTLARGADGLGISQNQVARATQTITDAFKVSGVSSRMASTAVLELSEAFGAGVLQGNHLKILMSDAPRLAKVLADSLGVPVSRLREMGAQGKLTSEMLIKAFTDTGIGEKLDAELATVPKTFGDVMTLLKNDAYNLSYAVVSSGDIASKAYDALSGSVTTIMPLFQTLGTVLGDIMSSVGSAFSNAYDFIMGVGDGTQSTLTVIQGLQVGLTVTGNVISALVSLVETGFELFVDAVGLVREALGGLSSMLGGTTQTAAASAKDQALSWIGLGNEVKVFTMGMSSAFSTAFQSIGDMFTDIENRAKSFFSGNFSAFNGIGDSLAKEFGKGKSAIDGLMTAAKNAGSKEVASAIFDKITGKDDKPEAVGDGLGTTRKVAPEAKEDKKGEAAAARRAKQEKEFWTVLQNEVTTAWMLPAQAADYNKEAELSKILGRDLNADEKKRVDMLMDQARYKKLINDIGQKNTTDQATLDYATKTLGMTERQKAVSDAAHEIEMKALQDRVPLTDKALQTEIEKAKVIAGQTYDIQKQAELLKALPATLATYSPIAKQAQDLKKLQDDRKNVAANTAEGETPAQKAQALYNIDKQIGETSDRFKSEFYQKIEDIGDQFGGKLGKIISGFGKMMDGLLAAKNGDFSKSGPLGGLVSLFGKNSDGSSNAFGKAASNGLANFTDQLSGDGLKKIFSDPIGSMSKSFSTLKDSFSKNGDLVKGLGTAVGGAIGGAQMGAQIAGVGKMLWSKFSTTGSELGGALGSAFGPLGSAIGSVAGGIIGGLFKSTPKGATSLSTNSYGLVTAGVTTGNNAKAEAASKESASSVSSGLNQIAQTLGASITGNIGNISIGQYNGKWRVQTDGSGVMKGGGSHASTLSDFGKDGEADAVEAAIKDALQQGVLTGLSDFSEQVLKNATDIDAATALAAKWESVLKDLTAMDDPAAGAVADLTKNFSDLHKQLVANGATTKDLADLDKWYTEKRKDALDDQLSDLQTFIDALNGDDSGKSSLDLLTQNLTKFQSFQNDLAAGKQVNQSDFTTLGQSIISEAKDVYGTSTSQYQDVLNTLMTAANSAVSNVTTAFNAATSSSDAIAAADAQTAATATVAQQTAISNDYLRQILAAIQSGSTVVGGGGSVSVNGKTVNAF